jgi:hypothetical protein
MRVVENAGITTPGTPLLYLAGGVAQPFSDVFEWRRLSRASVSWAVEKGADLFAFLENRLSKEGYNLSRGTS